MMNAQETFRRIIEAIRAHPDCRHVKCIIGQSSLKIIGKYKCISEALYCVLGGGVGYIAESCFDFRHYNVNTELRAYIDATIRRIREETRPSDNSCRAKRRFYKENFPCLAAEIDYSVYHDGDDEATDDDGIGAALRGARSIEQACPELCHWDLLAFERKVHAALDCSPLPLPIRDEIFSLFAIFD